jgi:hypothetical protein
MIGVTSGSWEAEAGRGVVGFRSARLGRFERTPTMTKEQKIIRAKVGLLELARQLGNVSQACKMMGSSRDSSIASRSFTTPRRIGAARADAAQTDLEEPNAARRLSPRKRPT